MGKIILASLIVALSIIVPRTISNNISVQTIADESTPLFQLVSDQPASVFPMLPETFNQLQLTDSQRNAINSYAEKFQEDWLIFTEEQQNILNQINLLISYGKYDEKIFRDLFKNLAVLQEESMLIQTKVTIFARSILTSEQKELLESLNQQQWSLDSDLTGDETVENQDYYTYTSYIKA